MPPREGVAPPPPVDGVALPSAPPLSRRSALPEPLDAVATLPLPEPGVMPPNHGAPPHFADEPKPT